jgi:hypothetical protein
VNACGVAQASEKFSQRSALLRRADVVLTVLNAGDGWRRESGTVAAAIRNRRIVRYRQSGSRRGSAGTRRIVLVQRPYLPHPELELCVRLSWHRLAEITSFTSAFPLWRSNPILRQTNHYG